MVPSDEFDEFQFRRQATIYDPMQCRSADDSKTWLSDKNTPRRRTPPLLRLCGPGAVGVAGMMCVAAGIVSIITV